MLGKHLLSPNYVYHRSRAALYHRREGDNCPNLALGAVDFLRGWLRPTDTMLEYGSGGSTRWFAQRVGRLVSVEDSKFWYTKVKAELSGFTNVEYHLFDEPIDSAVGELGASNAKAGWPYVNFIKSGPPEYFDVVLNDGWARHRIAIESIVRLKRGGILVFDDHDVPELEEISKRDEILASFLSAVGDWRRVSWRDGSLHKTCCFFKP